MSLRSKPLRFVAVITLVLFTVIFIKCNVARKAEVSSADLSQGVGSTGGVAHKTWTEYGGGADQSKFVDFKQINKENVSQLQVAWEYSTNDNVGSYKFNPIVVDNVMYVLAKNNSLVALDVNTGKEIWIHANLNTASKRGINYWESKDRKDRRLLFCVNNTLQAIDANTGKSILSFGTNGYVDLRQDLGRDPATIPRATSSSPGHVFEDFIYLGTSPGEGYFSGPGHLRAYNVITGKLAWVFHTIPHPGEFGYETWPKDAYKYVGGVNTWGEITVDEKRGIVYFPLGSPTFDYWGGDRHGTGLYGNCLLALDARTGKRLWHFQTVHHDIWDFDLAAAPQLVTVNHNGKVIDAVAQATKQGFLFTFNRVTGEPLFPIEERPVPKSNVPGEASWPTQPHPTVIPPYTRQKFTVNDINPFYPEEKKEEWRKRILAGKSGLFEPLSDKYETFTNPGANAGSTFGGTASNPSKGVVYVLSSDKPSVYKLKKEEPLALRVPLTADDTVKLSALYTQTCASCHGANKAGGLGPSLVSVNSRLNFENFHNVVTAGRSQMPAFLHLGDDNVINLYRYLSSNPGRQGAGAGGRGGFGPPAAGQTPEGPVVASGGAPIPQQPPLTPMRTYPEGVKAPKERYLDGSTTSYGLGYPDVGSPPWSSVTAYDLNTGKMMWTRPHGKDAQGRETGVPSGALGKGMLVTASGIIFATALDGSLYGYDADNGKILWSMKLPRIPEGIPSMYEIGGRQYLAVCVTGQLVDKTKAEADVPRKYMVFALPPKKS
jgi:quinoprotein glucose dehydrogenase